MAREYKIEIERPSGNVELFWGDGDLELSQMPVIAPYGEQLSILKLIKVTVTSMKEFGQTKLNITKL